MLTLRPAVVVECDPQAPAEASEPSGSRGEQALVVELGDGGGGERRRAIADVALVGPAERGDAVIVNALGGDLGGLDVVHVNLTRGLHGEGRPGAQAMKLDRTSLQHAVVPLDERHLQVALSGPVAVLALHEQLAAVAFAFAQAAGGRRLGYVQTGGGALPGAHSGAVAALRERGLLAGHITAGAAYGGEGEAMTTAGALAHALDALGWDAAVCGPGPGSLGSGSPGAHGAMAALDSAHVALALGCPTLLVARMSGSDERPRHRSVSQHTLTVLDLLLAPVTVALPAGMRTPVGSELRAGLRDVFNDAPKAATALEPDRTRPARIARHDWRRTAVDLPSYAAGGLPSEAMGRGPAEDPLFFGSALAGGGVLAEMVASAERVEAEGA